MLDFDKVDATALEAILAKVQRTQQFFKILAEIAEQNKHAKIPTFLCKEEVALILGIGSSHLAVLRHRGEGPTFLKVGQAVCYDVVDVLDYINSCRRTSTSTQGQTA